MENEEWCKESEQREDVIFTFIWSFKIGDNILYNFSVLKMLYKVRNETVQDWHKKLLNKPTIIIIVSIIESILYDFIHRVKEHRHEPVPNLTSEQIHDFRYKIRDGTLVEKQIKEFTHFIDQIRKHNLFDAKAPKFYEIMDYFRKVRNRIHIQNCYKDDLNPNEVNVFSNSNLKLVEALLEITIKKMFLKFPRPQNQDKLKEIDINKFPYPWK